MLKVFHIVAFTILSSFLISCQPAFHGIGHFPARARIMDFHLGLNGLLDALIKILIIISLILLIKILYNKNKKD